MALLARLSTFPRLRNTARQRLNTRQRNFATLLGNPDALQRRHAFVFLWLRQSIGPQHQHLLGRVQSGVAQIQQVVEDDDQIILHRLYGRHRLRQRRQVRRSGFAGHKRGNRIRNRCFQRLNIADRLRA